MCCSTLDLLVAPPTTALATNQICDEHNENESAECRADDDWHQVADGLVIGAIKLWNTAIARQLNNWQAMIPRLQQRSTNNHHQSSLLHYWYYYTSNQVTYQWRLTSVICRCFSFSVIIYCLNCLVRHDNAVRFHSAMGTSLLCYTYLTKTYILYFLITQWKYTTLITFGTEYLEETG